MRKIFLTAFLISMLIFSSCSSAKIISQTSIPPNKKNIYISLDNTQSTIASASYMVRNFFIVGTDSASFNTLDNRIIVKEQLISKGFSVTNKIETADLILLGGCESSDAESVVTLVLADSETEEEYCILQGAYGMGMDLKGDIKGALRNALQLLPTR